MSAHFYMECLFLQIALGWRLEGLYDKRRSAGQGQQTCPRGGDGQFALVGGQPAATKHLSHDGRDAATAEAIEHNVVGFGGSKQDAFEQRSGLLRGIAAAFRIALVQVADVAPDIRRRHQALGGVGIHASVCADAPRDLPMLVLVLTHMVAFVVAAFLADALAVKAVARGFCIEEQRIVLASIAPVAASPRLIMPDDLVLKAATGAPVCR